MLDADLAVLYEGPTKALNQAVKRNERRFPSDFMFRLTKKEKGELVTNCDRFESQKHSSALTIGEYRPSNGLANHISARFPESALLKVNKSLVREGGKLRYPQNLRIKMFRTIIEEIKKHKSGIDISLCKEQPEIWRALGLGMKGLSCKCVK